MDDNPYPRNSAEWLLHEEVKKEQALVDALTQQRRDILMQARNLRSQREIAEARRDARRTALERLVQS